MLPMTMTPISATSAHASAPPGMVEVPAGQFHFVAKGDEFYWLQSHGVPSGCGLQYPWETQPTTWHNKTLQIPKFYIDRFPVTCGDYAEYLTATGYIPRDPANWLRRWEGKRTPPAGWSKKPVTHVSLDEARAYCSWKGLRLPHSWEWQYAGQGNDTRPYPWGTTGWKAPETKYSNVHAGPAEVDAHLDGCSPFGVCDMVGNIWQYTDEFQDARTRFAMLKGGSNYRPSNFNHTMWYYRHAHELYVYNRIPLMDESFERAGTIGFRCAADGDAASSVEGAMLI